MTQFSLRGMGVAVITPFDDNLNIDFQALEAHVDRLIKGGADYLVVLGTTAETPTLTLEEDEAVKKCVVKACAGRVPLVLGVGGNCTAAVAKRLAEEDLSGFAAVLSVVPFYNKPSQEGMYQHYKALAEASPLPIVLYNVPGRTGVNMQPATTLRLAHDCDNIIGIKEASGKPEQVEAIAKDMPKRFEVVSGDDGLTVDFISRGAVGVISVIGNAYPHLFSTMVHDALKGDGSHVSTHEKLSALYSLIFTDGNPAGIKAVLKAMGLTGDAVRLPLTRVTEATAEAIRQEVEKIGND